MKKAPRNYSQDLDRRRQGLDQIVEKLDSIPDPTTEDAGKVLKVDNEGKLQLLDDTSTMVPMIVNISINPDSQSSLDYYIADETHANIKTALNSGRNVFVKYDDRYYAYTGTDKAAAFERISFTFIQADSSAQLNAKTFTINEDERIVYSEHDITEGLIPIKAVDTVTLTAGNTSVTISDIAITADSIFDIYTDTFGVNPTAANVSTGSLTLTFEEQAADVIVKVVIR